jgi:hypothetical protein
MCPDKQRLTDAIVQTNRTLQELHDREIRALVEGKTGLDRIDIALKLARQRRDDAKLEYLRHTQSHGC